LKRVSPGGFISDWKGKLKREKKGGDEREKLTGGGRVTKKHTTDLSGRNRDPRRGGKEERGKSDIKQGHRKKKEKASAVKARKKGPQGTNSESSSRYRGGGGSQQEIRRGRKRMV